ncbi:MAG: carboxypeptidase-like regulatory domain-containing protein, partial [Chitinophagales bacterium]|nr:carboxypeptidase-like regulatory domain-containing protein [Chitinophagales bacterium]
MRFFLFKYLQLVVFSISAICCFNQQIIGYVYDKQERTPLSGVAVSLLKLQDSSFVSGALTDENGKYSISAGQGKFILRFSYLGYKTQLLGIELSGNIITTPPVYLEPSASVLKEVVVEGTAMRAAIKDDTLEMKADAYKANPDATSEELIQKMPGITIENGTVRAKGEEVRRVLVDGKPFFGNDPAAVLKNLPAEVVDRVQVFDQMSDQSRFTGFSDGNELRAINIITRPNRNNGIFGKIYAGYGYLDAHRYHSGANINWFKGNRRISMLAMSNNINQQNFSV